MKSTLILLVIFISCNNDNEIIEKPTIKDTSGIGKVSSIEINKDTVELINTSIAIKIKNKQ